MTFKTSKTNNIQSNYKEIATKNKGINLINYFYNILDYTLAKIAPRAAALN